MPVAEKIPSWRVMHAAGKKGGSQFDLVQKYVLASAMLPEQLNETSDEVIFSRVEAELLEERQASKVWDPMAPFTSPELLRNA